MSVSYFNRSRGRAELTALLFLVVAGVAGFGGWYVSRRNPPPEPAPLARKILFYQSPMHPHIKSDRPGNCTICGMKLVPIYEGEPTTEQASPSVVKLSKQTVSTIQVETTPVVRRPLKRSIRIAGIIDDDDSTHRRLSAYVDGRVDSLYVNYVGAEVTAGQPLVALYSRDLLVARSEYTLATRMASPERETSVASTRRKLLRMGLTAAQIDQLPGQTGDTIEIVAPVGGTVVARNVYEGQYVKEGDVLFEIADFSKMWFVFEAYERDLTWIRVGQSVDITTPSVPGKVYRAPIAFIDPNLNPQTRSARVRVVLDNPLVGDPGKHRHELLHKVYADGSILVESEPVLAVPRSVILSPGGEPYVYVSKGDGAYDLRRVVLGRVGDDGWEVINGLDEGENVVTTGNLLIDAQAQLDSGHSDPPSAVESLPALAEAWREPATRLFTVVAMASEALASDRIDQYNDRIGELRESAADLVKLLGSEGKRLGKVIPSGPAKNLAEARTAFFPLSMAVTELVLHWRKKTPEYIAVKVFTCPMAGSAVPSATTNAGRWIQAGGTLRNPYFGAEMLTCGEEVKP